VADLDPPSEELEDALDALRRYSELRVFVSGHADVGEGAALESLKISERRARLVYEWLLAHGVAPEQLTGYKGVGTSDPSDFIETEAQRRHNRCVSLLVQ